MGVTWSLGGCLYSKDYNSTIKLCNFAEVGGFYRHFTKTNQFTSELLFN